MKFTPRLADDAHSHASNYYEVLRRQGYEELGSGSYGYVLRHPNKPGALKVFRPDRGYQTFVKFVQGRQKSNPAYPKFFGLPEAHTDRNGQVLFYTLEMEELEVMPYEVRGKSYIHDGINDIFGRRKKFSDQPFKKVVSEFPFTVAERRAISALRRLLRKDRDLYSDISRNNVMFRPSDGSLVITDPFVS